MTRALLIDIEGIDGAGKGTQARLLCDRLTAAEVSSALLSFPRYAETEFGRAVGEYLNGSFGTLDQVHPFLAALLFAGDRFESKGLLEQMLATRRVVVLDRYVPSNVAHQASKLPLPERAAFIQRILRIEHELFGLPRADLVLLLDLPVDQAQRLIARKAPRDYTAAAADIQEADGSYLGQVRQVYQELARSEPGWRRIDCGGPEGVRTVEEIHAQIWSAVAPRLDSLARTHP